MKPLLMAVLVAVATIAAAQADTPIQLPSGNVVKDGFFDVHPNWYGMFPEENPSFVEKYPSGNLQGIHGQKRGKLDGPSATLYESGHLKILASYSSAHRQGPLRVWDSDNQKLLYAEYKDNNKHGTLCLFQDGAPLLVQEWKNGELEGEGWLSLSTDKVYTCTAEKLLAKEDSQQFSKAKAKLAQIEEALDDHDGSLKKNVRSWFADIDKRIKEERVKILAPVKKAEATARSQAKREAAAKANAAAARAIDNHAAHTHVTPGGHLWVHRGGNAVTEYNRSATREEKTAAAADSRAASANAAATQRAAAHAGRQLNAKVVADFKSLHRFAMRALEKSLLDDRTDASRQQTSR